MNTLSLSLFGAFALLTACSSSPASRSEHEPSGDSSESSAPSDSSDPKPSTPKTPKRPKSPSLPGNAAAGTVGGAAFTVASGFAMGDAAGLDLVLSDMPSLCQSVTDAKVHAGETLIQLYALEGTVPGTFTSSYDEDPDIKYVTVKSTCASTTPIEDEIENAGRAISSTVTIKALTDTYVAGEIDITFDDGGTIAGEFNVPRCSAGLEKAATCF